MCSNAYLSQKADLDLVSQKVAFAELMSAKEDILEITITRKKQSKLYALLKKVAEIFPGKNVSLRYVIFKCDKYSIHVVYKLGSSKIKKIIFF